MRIDIRQMHGRCGSIALLVSCIVCFAADAREPVHDRAPSVGHATAGARDLPLLRPVSVWRQSAPERDAVSDAERLSIGRPADRTQFDPSVPEEHEPLFELITESCLEVLSMPVEPMACFFEKITFSEHDHIKTTLDDDPIGLQEIPERPRLVLELNEDFLRPGFLKQGIRIPTGAVWRPALWVFGTYRTGFAYEDDRAGNRFAEWANRLDLFGQLNLTGTERLVLGLRPLDDQHNNRRTFTSYEFQQGDWTDGTNAELQTLFFEGELGEIFPGLDPFDRRELDIGFSVGRQPMLFQQGLLINEDRIDALTATRNTINGGRLLNLRATSVYAWGDINRNNNAIDHDAQLVGLFTESDFKISTVNADIAYVDSSSSFGSLLAFGLSAIQRFHLMNESLNTSFHVLGSFPIGAETVASGRGLLLFAQTSWTPRQTEDLVYLNGFWAIDQFTSPARGPLSGGPIGQTGVLFSAPGLGRFAAPLSSQANEAAGASIGYQMFFDHTKKQVILEFGGRKDTNGIGQGALGVVIRYQQALNQHWVAIIDGAAGKAESRGVSPGARFEMLAKF